MASISNSEVRNRLSKRLRINKCCNSCSKMKGGKCSGSRKCNRCLSGGCIECMRGGITGEILKKPKEGLINQELEYYVEYISHDIKNVDFYGSYIFRGQTYPGDIDLNEFIVGCCTPKEVFKKMEKILINIIKKIEEGEKNNKRSSKYLLTKDAFFSELKCGYDYRFKNLNPRDNNFFGEIKHLHNAKMLTDEEYRKMIILRNEDTEKSLDELDEMIRLKFTVRWDEKEIVQRYKYLGPGRTHKLTLLEAISHGSQVKVDIWAFVGSNLLELTNYFILVLYNPKTCEIKMLNDPDGLLQMPYIKSMQGQIKKLSSPLFFSPLKMAKRMWSIGRVTLNEELLDKLNPLFQSDAARLNRLKAELETVIGFAKKYVGKEYVDTYEIDICQVVSNFKSQLSGIYQIELDYDYVYKLVDEMHDQCDKVNKTKLIDSGEKLKEYIKKINDKAVLKYLEDVGLYPVPKWIYNLKGTDSFINDSINKYVIKDKNSKCYLPEAERGELPTIEYGLLKKDKNKIKDDEEDEEEEELESGSDDTSDESSTDDSDSESEEEKKSSPIARPVRHPEEDKEDEDEEEYESKYSQQEIDDILGDFGQQKKMIPYFEGKDEKDKGIIIPIGSLKNNVQDAVAQVQLQNKLEGQLINNAIVDQIPAAPPLPYDPPLSQQEEEKLILADKMRDVMNENDKPPEYESDIEPPEFEEDEYQPPPESEYVSPPEIPEEEFLPPPEESEELQPLPQLQPQQLLPEQKLYRDKVRATYEFEEPFIRERSLVPIRQPPNIQYEGSYDFLPLQTFEEFKHPTRAEEEQMREEEEYQNLLRQQMLENAYVEEYHIPEQSFRLEPVEIGPYREAPFPTQSRMIQPVRPSMREINRKVRDREKRQEQMRREEEYQRKIDEKTKRDQENYEHARRLEEVERMRKEQLSARSIELRKQQREKDMREEQQRLRNQYLEQQRLEEEERERRRLDKIERDRLEAELREQQRQEELKIDYELAQNKRELRKRESQINAPSIERQLQEQYEEVEREEKEERRGPPIKQKGISRGPRPSKPSGMSNWSQPKSKSKSKPQPPPDYRSRLRPQPQPQQKSEAQIKAEREAYIRAAEENERRIANQDTRPYRPSATQPGLLTPYGEGQPKSILKKTKKKSNKSVKFN